MTTTTMRCLIEYASDADYVVCDLRRPSRAEALDHVVPELADRLLLGVGPADGDREIAFTRCDLDKAGWPLDDTQYRGFVLGAHTICHEITPDYEARLLAARDARLLAERRPYIARTCSDRPPIGGSCLGPCPRCGSYCEGDCQFSPVGADREDNTPDAPGNY